jgi:hypothetical protein
MHRACLPPICKAAVKLQHCDLQESCKAGPAGVQPQAGKIEQGGLMMAGFFSKLFGGGGETETAGAEPEDYKGYEIEPRPKGQSGTYNIAGIIRRKDDPDGRVHKFIRADTFTNIEDAIHFSRIKARQMIDQQGDRLFE